MRKRFCNHTCRNRFHNSKQGLRAPVDAPVSPQVADARQRTLERIYAELKVDIEERGSVIDGRVNPAVEAIRKIGIELDRRGPQVEEEADDDTRTLRAI